MWRYHYDYDANTINYISIISIIMIMMTILHQGSADSDYSLQSSEFSTDDDPEALRKETEVLRKETENQAMTQLEKARVCQWQQLSSVGLHFVVIIAH